MNSRGGRIVVLAIVAAGALSACSGSSSSGTPSAGSTANSLPGQSSQQQGLKDDEQQFFVFVKDACSESVGAPAVRRAIRVVDTSSATAAAREQAAKTITGQTSRLDDAVDNRQPAQLAAKNYRRTFLPDYKKVVRLYRAVAQRGTVSAGMGADVSAARALVAYDRANHLAGCEPLAEGAAKL
jgi:hypothetical protein